MQREGGDVGTDTEVTFEQDVKLQNSGTTTTDLTMCTTSYMPISNSKTVRWGNTNGNIGILCEYKDGYTFSDYWEATQNPRTINLTGGTNVKYIRASFPIATLDYCYVLDVTNNVYLYKGSKVE